MAVKLIVTSSYAEVSGPCAQLNHVVRAGWGKEPTLRYFGTYGLHILRYKNE